MTLKVYNNIRMAIEEQLWWHKIIRMHNRGLRASRIRKTMRLATDFKIPDFTHPIKTQP